LIASSSPDKADKIAEVKYAEKLNLFYSKMAKKASDILDGRIR